MKKSFMESNDSFASNSAKELKQAQNNLHGTMGEDFLIPGGFCVIFASQSCWGRTKLKHFRVMNTKAEEMKAKIFYLWWYQGIKEESGTWPTHSAFHRGFSIPLSHFKNRELSWTESARSYSCFIGFEEPENVFILFLRIVLSPSLHPLRH